MYGKLKDLSKVIVVARTSKTLAFVLTNNRQVLNANLTVIASSSYAKYLILQSSLHNSWAWQYCTTMKTDLIYQPSDVYETFPFANNLTQQHEKLLNTIGKTYHEHRRQHMLSMQLGLTKTYNAFHAKEIQAGITKASLQGMDKKAIEKQHGKEVWNLWNHLQKTLGTCSIEEAVAGIVKLRELHVEMDEAVLEAYGWHLTPDPSPRVGGIDLRHDFYEVDYLPENDRVRFTIHPEARKEILKRLLELNHKIFEQEAHEGLHKEETVRKFYEQKGISVPEEVSKWFNKTKKYKTLKPKSPKVEEDGGGYGDLFNL